MDQEPRMLAATSTLLPQNGCNPVLQSFFDRISSDNSDISVEVRGINSTCPLNWNTLTHTMSPRGSRMPKPTSSADQRLLVFPSPEIESSWAETGPPRQSSGNMLPPLAGSA